MSYKHGHDKQHNHGHGKNTGRDRQQRIPMVKQRSLLAMALAFGLVAFVALALLTVVAYMIWG